MTRQIILASTSPRRKQLLEILSIKFRAVDPNYEEIVQPGLGHEEQVKFLALGKAKAAAKKFPNAIIIAADTMVSFNGKIMGKPENEKEAFKILKQLNGNKHFVFTGICLIKNGKKKIFQVESEVTFCRVDDDVIKEYINIYKPFDKAGSYGAQETLRRGFNPCSSKELDFVSGRVQKNQVL